MTTSLTFLLVYEFDILQNNVGFWDSSWYFCEVDFHKNEEKQFL